MAQNLVSLPLSSEQMATVDNALNLLEEALGGLVSLNVEDRRRLTKMGQKSEAFCRQTLNVLSNNLKVVPPSLEFDEVLLDLQALDLLRPRLMRLRQLAERGDDTEMALGADLMEASLTGYALLKVAGKAMGLDAQRRELGSRWSRRRRNGAQDEAPEEAEAES